MLRRDRKFQTGHRLVQHYDGLRLPGRNGVRRRREDENGDQILFRKFRIVHRFHGDRLMVDNGLR